MKRPFLTARWSHLILITYSVPASLLQDRLAPGLSLDTIDGQAFVSLVGFEFLETRVLGVSWPGYRNFAELNLRFYVRHGADRGVMFVREFVPQHLAAWIARVIYNEPYKAAPLEGSVLKNESGITVEYRLRFAGKTHKLSATSRKPPHLPPPESVEHFFKEHRWGFGKSRSGNTTRYEVAHPAWDVYPVDHYHVDLDWASVYGPEWKILDGAEPYSIVLAAGSPVAVYMHTAATSDGELEGRT
jgi:uncharacterized protein YqjF (DUF2071 family)